MLRTLNKNILLATLTLLSVFGLATLVAPSYAQALDSAGSISGSQVGFEIGSLRNVAASCTPGNCTDPAITCTSNSSNCNLIQKYVVPTINLLSVAFGLIAVISLLLGAINYITSEGDPQKVARAKVRIRNTIFSVVAFMFLYAFLNFLIPGGIFR